MLLKQALTYCFVFKTLHHISLKMGLYYNLVIEVFCRGHFIPHIGSFTWWQVCARTICNAVGISLRDKIMLLKVPYRRRSVLEFNFDKLPIFYFTQTREASSWNLYFFPICFTLNGLKSNRFWHLDSCKYI